MAIFEPTDENLSKAGELIRQGELVSFATETVYGLGANALNPEACEKIFKAKNRPHYDPLIVHLASVDQVDDICKEMPTKAQQAAEAFWPGSLTMILPKKDVVPDSITANLDTVAVRIPNHPVALGLLQNAKVPIAAPSANPFGYLSPTTAAHVEEQLGDKLQIILDGGECDCGVESTIIDFTTEPPELLRFGGISQEQIESVCGKINLGKPVLERPLAPGQLASHYSPNTELIILKEGESAKETDGKVGFLKFGDQNLNINVDQTEEVSLDGNLEEAAHNLFSALHKLDDSNLDVIYAYEFPDKGIGRAIMDRLKKAAVKL
ncbi:MAG: L-threonylcarbamoyladenylate synthase [Lentisphaeraceae bacterium]|nr:L-threonylcarbamoyladenylate synthase [Lentisphaeraceae bacterium]